MGEHLIRQALPFAAKLVVPLLEGLPRGYRLLAYLGVRHYGVEPIKDRLGDPKVLHDAPHERGEPAGVPRGARLRHLEEPLKGPTVSQHLVGQGLICPREDAGHIEQTASGVFVQSDLSPLNEPNHLRDKHWVPVEYTPGTAVLQPRPDSGKRSEERKDQEEFECDDDGDNKRSHVWSQARVEDEYREDREDREGGDLDADLRRCAFLA